MLLTSCFSETFWLAVVSIDLNCLTILKNNLADHTLDDRLRSVNGKIVLSGGSLYHGHSLGLAASPRRNRRAHALDARDRIR